MKITFRQTGGFVGLVKSAAIDTAQLPPEQVAQWQTLVEQCQFFTLAKPGGGAMPDGEQYSIRIEMDGRSRQMQMGRGSVPPELKPLVDQLAQQAKYEKR